MSKALNRFVVFTAAVGLILLSEPAWGRILLKQSGEHARPLRAKAVRADVTVDRQFATTKLELTFANDSSSRIEADFIYTLPPGAVATYFAYWFGEEKVIARIVEKKRAAAIYRHITTQMRDPALIEMIDKNTFRARIFPVMPNSDLRVEIHMAQVLPSDPTGVVYELPLREEEAEPEGYNA